MGTTPSHCHSTPLNYGPWTQIAARSKGGGDTAVRLQIIHYSARKRIRRTSAGTSDQSNRHFQTEYMLHKLFSLCPALLIRRRNFILPEDGNKSSFRNIAFLRKHWTMDKVQTHYSSKCNTPSSEHFRIDVFCCPMTKYYMSCK
jgi:hypothetical protein